MPPSAQAASTIITPPPSAITTDRPAAPAIRALRPDPALDEQEDAGRRGDHAGRQHGQHRRVESRVSTASAAKPPAMMQGDRSR